jgi:thioredoxin 1
MALSYLVSIKPAGAQTTFIAGYPVWIDQEGKDSNLLRGRSGAILAQEYDEHSLPDASAEKGSSNSDRTSLAPKVTKDTPIVVDEIIPGSPAEQAGLHEDDVVYAVGDLKTEGSTLAIVSAAFTGKPGTSIHVLVGRTQGGVVTTLSLNIPLVELNPSTLLDVDRSNFEKEVAESKIPVFIAWKADWCPYCIADEPMLSKLQHHFEGRIKFVRIDSDDSPHLIRFPHGEDVVPSSVFYVPGRLTHLAIVGSQSQTILLALLNNQLSVLRLLQAVRTGISVTGLVMGLFFGVLAAVYVKKKITRVVVDGKEPPIQWVDDVLLKLVVLILCAVSFTYGWSTYFIALCGFAAWGFGFVAGFWMKRSGKWRLHLPATA